MNFGLVISILGKVMIVEAGLMVLPALIAILYSEPVKPFVIAILIILLFYLLTKLVKPKRKDLYAKEGFTAVGLSWVFMSLFGAIPFVVSGDIPNYISALFETVSGFTTTGASVMSNVETMGKACMFWRMFTHWIGGMGVLVFLMAVVPMHEEHYMHIMRAEVPGPTVGKLVPKAKETAKILYMIYLGMTIIEIIFLVLGGMNLYDAVINSFATAGTGGFSNRCASIGYYNSGYIDIVIATFMILFGINFNLYYFILIGKAKNAFKSEELKVYLGIILVAVIIILFNTREIFGNVLQGLRYSYFQVASIITTTGFSTTDFNNWPSLSKWVLVLLMFTGACAGSTGGGIKVSRIIVLIKSFIYDIRKQVSSNRVGSIWLEGKKVEDQTVRDINVFFGLYIFILLISILIISIDGLDLETNFTGALACISNIGPGLSLVGPAGNFACFSGLSKIVLIIDMLIGRLEIFPIIFLFMPSTWKGLSRKH